MSEAFDRGRTFERKVASILRKKLGARVERDRRSGAGINKSDISDYYQEIPLHMEIKDQETLKPKEWFRQAEAAASFTQAPTVIFAMDEEVLALLRFSDLVNFLVEIADQKAEIDDLRTPIVSEPQLKKGDTVELKGFGPNVDGKAKVKLVDLGQIKNVVELRKSAGQKSCREGHLADEYGYCQQLKCKYSRGYRPPKAKRK